MKKITALCFMMSMLMSHIVSGQEAANDISDKSLKNYKMPPNLKQYFVDKYSGQFSDIYSTVRETPYGPRGKVHIMGRIKHASVSAHQGDLSARSRAIATAFLKEESAFFGLVDINERA